MSRLAIRSANRPRHVIGAGMACLLVVHPLLLWAGTAVGTMLVFGGLAASRLVPGPRSLFYPLLGFAIFTTIGAVGSPLWGYGFWIQSWGMALTSWLGLLIYCANATPHIWRWVLALASIHAIMGIVQGLRHLGDAGYRAYGVFDAGTSGSGLVALGTVWVVSSRFWPVVLPLLLALHFMASRAGFWAMWAVLALMVARRTIPWSRFALLVAFSALITVTIWPQGERLFTIGPSTLQQEAQLRLSAPDGVPPSSAFAAATSPAFEASPSATLAPFIARVLPHLVPNGYSGDHVHSLLRLYYDLGPGGLALWLVATGRGLWHYRHDASRWPVLALVLLASLLEFYFLMPPLALLWWAALSPNRA